MIYTLRTTVGRENAVMETLSNKIRNTGVDVKSIFRPGELKGYIFIEGDISAVEKAIGGVPHIRGIIHKEVKILELKKFLETKKVEIKITRGDIIEVIGGPFKNEKGKVVRVDEAKDEVTIELLEAAVPIPITVAIDSVRLIESGSKAAETKT
jgi:transcriptional antiterminator NusG